ncbi:MAG: hypothetical protein U5K75_07050 [Ahrensia sp.]|nr:hypothetical protein [Ahrensia sp.]
MNKRFLFIAELTFAGILVGLLIGPSSLNDFVGFAYENSMAMNLIVGAFVGGFLGFIGSLSLEKTETE